MKPDATQKIMIRGRTLLFALSLSLLFGCSGNRAFHEVARAGDTVAIAAGWQQNFSRDRISVFITPADGGPDIVLGPDNPAIRAVVNFYPDPISSLVVSRRTGQDITPFARTYAGTTATFAGNQDDWWQTIVFIDLPFSLPVGSTGIWIEDPGGGNAYSTLDIVSGVGKKNTFDANAAGVLTRGQLASLERASYYLVTFSGTTVPYAIQLDFTHDADVDLGGVGKAYAVNPISGAKAISWTDDGSSMRVVLMPSGDKQIGFSDFRFYVAGGIQNLINGFVKAFDIAGNPVVGVSVSVSANNIVLNTN